MSSNRWGHCAATPTHHNSQPYLKFSVPKIPSSFNLIFKTSLCNSFSQTMATATSPLLSPPKPLSPLKPATTLLSPPPKFRTPVTVRTRALRSAICGINPTQKAALGIFGAGLALTVVEPASASEFLLLGSLQLTEPANALSLPTWAIHVSSVVEWITAMFLVWQYGEQTGFESWKGLSWGMVPSLGGALCACTWHFFYNAESLEVLVALQAALTVLGNATMCFAAFRIYKSSQGRSENL